MHCFSIQHHASALATAAGTALHALRHSTVLPYYLNRADTSLINASAAVATICQAGITSKHVSSTHNPCRQNLTTSQGL